MYWTYKSIETPSREMAELMAERDLTTDDVTKAGGAE